MIALDTSSLVAYLANETGEDVADVEFALEERCAVFSPVVIAEILSDHKSSKSVVLLIKQLPTLTISPGYWAALAIGSERDYFEPRLSKRDTRPA